MVTQEQQKALAFYANIMEEVKARISAVEGILIEKPKIFPPLIQEFCYLQFRMICELIACACLTAHGDLTFSPVGKMKKEYLADKIINALEKLSPSFFPKPVKLSLQVDGIHMEEVPDGFLTKQEFLSLYRKGGDILHRRYSTVSLISPSMQINYYELAAWLKKISTLLSCHHIASFDNTKHIVCALKYEGAGGNVYVVIAQP